MERKKDREVIREGSARGAGRRRTVVGVVREDRDRKVKDGGVEGGTGDVEAVQAGSDRERTVSLLEDAENRVLVGGGLSDSKVLPEGGELVDERKRSNRRMGRGRVRRSVDEVEVATAKGRKSARDGAHTLKESTLQPNLIRARGEVAVEKKEGLVGGGDGVVATALDVTPTVSGERNVGRGEVTKARGCVNNKSASHAALKVVEGNFAVRERRESKPFIPGKVRLLEANDITLGDEVSQGPKDEVLPAVAGDVESGC